MADVFVSYSRVDKSRASEIVGVLEADGWNVFWDQELRSGTSWPKVLETELDDARCLVALWTAASVESRWVRIEAYEALQQDKLLPVLLDNVRPPLEFRQTQTQDLVGWSGARDDPRIKRMLDDLRTIANAPRQVRKAPAIQPAQLPDSPQREPRVTATSPRKWLWAIGAAATLAVAVAAFSVRPPSKKVGSVQAQEAAQEAVPAQAISAPATKADAAVNTEQTQTHTAKAVPAKCRAILEKYQQTGRVSEEEQAYLRGKECA